VQALVVDAQGPRRDVLREELARQGHEVVAVDSTRGALAQAAGGLPPFVVIAWRVGADDGLELCRALLSAAADEPPIVVLVGADDEVELLAALDAGAVDVWALEPAFDGPRAGLRVRLALAEHVARLQAEHVRIGGELALLCQALDGTGTGFVLTDPGLEDNPIVYANRSFLELTGYPEEEVLGRNCRFLQGSETEPERVAELRRAVAEERPVSVELHNHRSDGTAFSNQVHVAPVRDHRGCVVRFVGVQLDVTASRRQERLVALEQRARRAAEVAERRSAFLAEASPLLDATLDLRRTLDSLARLCVPGLADACLVHVVHGDRVQRVTATASDEALERLLRALPERYGLARDPADPLARVVLAGRSELLGDDAAGALGPTGREAVERGTLRRHRPRAAMVVPLRARRRSVGVLSLLAVAREAPFGAEELSLAEDVARRAALALDNAALYEQQRDVARVLQDSLLPERLPELPGLELAARYRPAGDGSEIGGDFFDVFPVAGGSTALLIGDVTGKGARAAALTGLTKHTLRTAGLYEQDPSALLTVLNGALLSARNEGGRYCTVALCTLRPQDGGALVRLAVAGHPLPFVVRAGGEVAHAGRPGTLLGYVPDLALRDDEVHLGPGDALVLYTDGVTGATAAGPLVDDRLGELLRAAAGADAEALAGRVEAAAVDAQDGAPRDDVAVAVVRVAP